MPSIQACRAFYPADDSVHGFSHVLRVYRLSESIAKQEGADLKIVRAAALLHDVDGDVDLRQEHHLAAANFAERILREEGWEPGEIESVLHCIKSHRYRNGGEQPETLEAMVLFDADKLDAIGAVGIARAVSYAIRAGMDVYAPPSPAFLATGKLAPGESQTVAHEYFFKLRQIKDRLFTETGRALARERHLILEDFFRCWMNEIGDYADYQQDG